MAASYFQLHFNDRATFGLSVRRMPPRRGFLIAAGIERLLEIVADFHFEQPALEFLDSLKLFEHEFLQFLAGLHFSGDIVSAPEGGIFFANEPILEITAPLIEAQLLESIVMNQVGFASVIASKAARSVIASQGRRLVDFGLRRSQGADASLVAARSSYLAGFIGTSNVLAGRRYGIPLYGTMAHSYVMAHDSERAAFEHYVALFPKLSTLLVDTYDTARGVENAARTALELKRNGFKLQAIRIDSGNLVELSAAARQILDREGLQDVSIFASGNLDEYRVAELVQAGAPIDAFGVGTEMVVSGDAPALDIAYKLSEYAGVPRLKTSTQKTTVPGRKQVFRAFSENGGYHADLVGLADEGAATVSREFNPAPHHVTPLLELRTRGGQPVGQRQSLEEARQRALESMARLEARYKHLNAPANYPVNMTAALNAMLINARIRADRSQD